MITFLRRKRQTVGLDIGSGYVKAAVIDHSGPEPELVRVVCLPLAPDSIVEGEIMDPQAVVDTVRSVLESAGIPAARVVTAVGGRDVIVKKIQMDRMARDDAREVIRWEAEQYVPFDMASVQLDFQILDPADDGLQMSVLLVAAKRDLVDQKMLLLEEAGLKPAGIDVDAFALHNAFEYNYPEASEGLIAVINVGNEIATVIAQHDGVPVLSLDIPFGSRRLRDELRRLHGFSTEEAELAVQGRSSRAAEVARALADRYHEFAAAVERATAFLTLDTVPSRGLSAVYLAGGGARVPGLDEALAERLRVRIEIANPLQRLRVRAGATTQLPEGESASMLMLPVGLALRTPA
jgi:type IV pilus assembly protein PilM